TPSFPLMTLLLWFQFRAVALDGGPAAGAILRQMRKLRRHRFGDRARGLLALAGPKPHAIRIVIGVGQVLAGQPLLLEVPRPVSADHALDEARREGEHARGREIEYLIRCIELPRLLDAMRPR